MQTDTVTSGSSILAPLKERYDRQLRESILPFWLEHGLDRIHDGMLTALDRDGSLLDSDKSVWFQGRALWTFSTAYCTDRSHDDWLAAATSCARFLERHCFDSDGRMFFRTTRDGKPVIKRSRYVFSETFAILGWAAFSRATGDTSYALKALGLFKQVLSWLATPGFLIPKFNPEHEPSRGFGVPMILLNTAQELRMACPDETTWLTSIIDTLIGEIETYFVRPDLQSVLEQCAPDGTFQADHFEGRLLNPGHAIEGAWFIMNEARHRADDSRLAALGIRMLDWMWDIGWDREYGGLYYFRDALGKSPTEYWHDMKFWWPHNEAAIANLMAYRLDGRDYHLKRFLEVDRYVHDRFADPVYGEWFGYLHRDGSLSTPLKGNMFKGPFHVPRMYLTCLPLLDNPRREGPCGC
jgi:N-acylglucosamine 2-epimerase